MNGGKGVGTAAALLPGLAACSQPASKPSSAAVAASVSRVADGDVADYLVRFPESAVLVGVDAPASEHLFDNRRAALLDGQQR